MLDVGSTIGDYRLEERIGRGGMGVVFRATQLSLGRSVALKVIAPELAADPDFRERFKSEARLAARMDHPNVVPVHQADEHDGQLFISMRYVPGTDLGALLRRRGPLDPAHAVRIVEQLAAALDAAHERGLVHRDVKPANVLLSGKEGAEHVYLTDFGLTKQVGSTGVTRTGAFVGTHDYVAPEQIRGTAVDGRADVYALGCVLFQLLTASVPFDRDSDVAKLYAHMSEPPPRASEVATGIPPALDAVIERAMAKDPEARYATAGAFAAAARAALAAGPAVPAAGATVVSPTRADAPVAAAVAPLRRPPDPPTREQPRPAMPDTPRPARTRRGALLAALAAAAVVAVGLVLVLTKDDTPKTPTGTATTAGGAALVQLSPARVTANASSTLPHDGAITYAAANTTDGNPRTAWAEGEPGTGTGATITWTFDAPVDLRRVELVNGYGKTEQFAKNLRISEAEVTTAAGRQTTTLEDTATPQPLTPPAGKTDFVRLRILGTYGADADQDCLVSEAEFFVAPG